MPVTKARLRALKVGSTGKDVEAVQKAANSRLRARGQAEYLIAVDGDFGPLTARACSRALYVIGIRGPRLEQSKVEHGGQLDERAVEVLRWPSKRTKGMRERERRRMAAIRKAQKAAMKGRAGALKWARAQVGTTENPPGSNRGGKITEWEQLLGAWLVGQPWCGTFAANALIHAGVQGVTFRLAGVANIEDDARAGRAPFVAWTTDASRVRRGDLVVLFGRGVHVALVDSIDLAAGVVHTVEGNTSFGTAGSQSNGGCVAARTRSLSDVHGFALVAF